MIESNHDQDDYKQRLKEILKQAKKKAKRSKSRSFKNNAESSPKRYNSISHYKPTPYRPTLSESKVVVNDFEVEMAFDVSPSTSFEKSKNRNISGNAINFASKKNSSIKKSKSATTSEGAEPSTFGKKTLKRRSTPYHDSNKKRKRKEVDLTELSFPGRNLEDEFDNESDEFENDCDFVPAHNSTRVTTTKKVKKRKKNNENADVTMKVGELIYEDQDVTPDIYYLLASSDSENSDHSEEFNITSDCSGAEINCNSKELAELRVVVDELESNSSLKNSNESVDSLENDIDQIVKKVSPECDETDFRSIAEPTFTTVNNKLLVTLPPNLKLYFHGLISSTVLYGEVKVLGYNLNPSSGSKEMFCPRGTSFFYFETKKEHGLTTNLYGLVNTFIKIGMKDQDAQEFCEKLDETSAVILCEKINDCKIAFLEKYIDQQIFPRNKQQQPRCIFKSAADNWNVLNINSEWDALISHITYSSRALICGGKSVGKSTLLRYMLNSLLIEHESVLVIDLDPGQPEFTVSGCISATIVNEPVFGPNYTHLRKPDRCLFLSNINISYDPHGYLSTVKELIQLCSDLPKLPTIINYMGFTRGIGLEIFSAVVACVQPTSIIEIESSNIQQNFKNQLTYKLISSRSKLLAGNEANIPEFSIYTVQSETDTNQGWHLKPRQIREMCVLSYFNQLLPAGVVSLTDNRIPVYVTDLSEVKIIHVGEIVNSTSVINGNLVALCSKSTSFTSFICYGWGIVRGINTATNELLLLTPLPPDELEQVDHLVLGSVSLPPSLHMTSDNMGLIPYVCTDEMDIMGRIPKRTHLPIKAVKQD